eukprot:5135936-Alexandrium_andersonii.AAC.1
MARVLDSEAGPSAVPTMLGTGHLKVAGKRYTVPKDAVLRPQMPMDGPEPAERTFQALQRLADNGVGPHGSTAI